MTLTIELTPEEARRVEEARRNGVDVDAILRQSIANIPTSKPKTGAEALAFWKKEKSLGIWQDRPDTPELAQQLRREAEARGDSE